PLRPAARAAGRRAFPRPRRGGTLPVCHRRPCGASAMSSDQLTPNPQPPDPQPRAPRFDAEPYRPDGAAPFGGLALLMGGVFATAMGLGLVLSFLGQWIYIPFIFPILAGLLLGAAAQGLVRAGRVRSPAV